MRYALALLLLGGCLRSTAFKCERDPDCGAGGTCEAVGYCSFADTDCQRFGASAGPYANQCVDAVAEDAGVDTPTTGNRCPADFMEVAGLPHRYRRDNDNASFIQHRTRCQNPMNNSYLAIPDTQAELTALAALANNNKAWIGIEDTMTEGQWKTVLGAPQTLLPWAPGSPTLQNNNNDDCVQLVANAQFDDVRCVNNGTNAPALCECEP